VTPYGALDNAGARLGSPFETHPRVGYRRLAGALDPALTGLNVGGVTRSGDFGDIVRAAGRMSNRHRPLSSAWVVSSDQRLRHIAGVPGLSGPRYRAVPRFGAPVATGSSDERSGLVLASRASEAGLVISLPFIPAQTTTGTVRVFAAIKHARLAAAFPADPASALTAPTFLLPRLPPNRDVFVSDVALIEIPQNDAATLSGGTIQGKRFIVDAVRRRVLVLTDELGVFQAFVH
jgi:hypothetical protein